MQCKRTLALCVSALFAASSLFTPARPVRAQEPQQQGEPLRELQEQWRQIMKNEYNPAARAPNPDAKPTFGPEREKPGKHSSRSVRKGSRSRSAKLHGKNGRKYSSKSSKSRLAKKSSGTRTAKAGFAKNKSGSGTAGKSRFQKTSASKVSGSSRAKNKPTAKAAGKSKVHKSASKASSSTGKKKISKK